MTRIIMNRPAFGKTFKTYTLADESGALARTTEGGVFETRHLSVAKEAEKFLNQRREQRREGSLQMKSIFGVH